MSHGLIDARIQRCLRSIAGSGRALDVVSSIYFDRNFLISSLHINRRILPLLGRRFFSPLLSFLLAQFIKIISRVGFLISDCLRALRCTGAPDLLINREQINR